MRGYIRSTVAALAVAIVIGLSLTLVARADQAPFWESPVGLVPGNPDIQVRMAAETVDINVVERGDAIHALVTANFTMVNDGTDATVKVGFPASTVSLFDQLAEPDATGVRRADAPGMFTAQNIRAFEVAVNGQALRSWRQDIPNAAAAGFGADWAMWEMTFPAGQTTTVDVSYEQVLTERANDVYVQPMYVLRTGALWSGVIGEATVTLRAEGGGALVGGPELYWRLNDAGVVTTYPRAEQVYGPADAAEANATTVIWRFKAFEPTRDAGATYVRSSVWRAYADADRAILTGGSGSASALRDATVAALAIVGGPAACAWDTALICVSGRHGTPRGLVDRLADTARERARRAMQLAPDDPSVLQAFGDVEFWYAMPTKKHHGELACWPSNVADAYEKAQTLGGQSLEMRLESLRSSARQTRVFGDSTIQTCSGTADTRLEVELVRATVDQGNAAWTAGVGYRGTAERYALYFDGRWLAERTSEVDDLRRNRQTRQTELKQIQYANITIQNESTASVETVETWDDRTLAENGQLVRDVSGQLRQRYDLRKVSGQWKIVDAEIIRG